MTDATFSTTPAGDRIRDRFAVFSNTTLFGRGTDVLLAMVDYQDRIVATSTAVAMEYKPADELAQFHLAPTFSGPAGTEFLQAALDAAWRAGLRPKNWRLETTEQVAAMRDHLNDMRRLVFDERQTLPPLPKSTDYSQKD